MNRLLSMLLILLTKSMIVVAQFSVIQDGEGETSFQILTSNTIAINAEKTSIGFSIRPKDFTNTNTNYWTITSSANAKDGISNIFKGGEFQFSGRLSANLLKDRTSYPKPGVLANTTFIFEFLGLEALYSRFNVFDESKAFDRQIYDRTNIGLRLNYGWNFIGAVICGISGSIGIKDNTDIVDQVQITTISKSISNGSYIKTVSSVSEAYDVKELDKSAIFGRINFDVGRQVFNNRALVNFHLTSAFDKENNPSFNPALGLFITKNGAPMEAIVGLQIQSNDIFNLRDSPKNTWERTSLVLTFGFPFN